jgi:energy-converting hydrogenase B subunit C
VILHPIDAVILSCSAAIFLGCLGLLRFGESKNIIYARIHIAGVIDVACIVMMFALGYPLVGLAYLALTPISAHAIANAHHLSQAKRRAAAESADEGKDEMGRWKHIGDVPWGIE